MSGTPKNGTRPKLWFQFLSSDFLPPQEICLFQSRFRSLEGFSITLHKQAKSTVPQILGTFSLGWLLANTRDVEETTLGSELWAWAGGPGRPNCLPGWMGKGRIEWHSFFFTTIFSCTLWRLSSRQHHTLLHMFGCPVAMIRNEQFNPVTPLAGDLSFT